MTDSYADLATFRTYIRAAAVVDDADDPDSAIETLALEASARAIDRACGRTFGVAASGTRYYTATRSTEPPDIALEIAPLAYPYVRGRSIVVNIDDLAGDAEDVTISLDLDGSGTYATPCLSFRLGPRNAPSRGMPYSRLVLGPGIYAPLAYEAVKVTAPWGWTATPSTIVNANLLQAARFIKRRDAPFGVAGSPELGNELRLLAKLDPDVAVMVGAFKRNWAAA